MSLTPDAEITLLLAKNAALRQHWADDDTRIKEITKGVLPNFDADGGGYFVDMVECAEAMAARIRELEGKWRKEPPDAPGWYWWRSEKFPAPDIVWIYRYGPGLKVNDPSERLSSQQLSPEESGGEWSGPILPPKGGAE